MCDYYSSVKLERGLMGNLSYFTAEARAPGGRLHQRLFANAPLKSAIHGKPLFYADTYFSGDTPTVYTYARHKSDAKGFFDALSIFYQEIADPYELKGKEFSLVANLSGNLSVLPLRLPIIPTIDLQGLRFCRISLPIGDIAVEFAPMPLTAGNQLDQCVKDKEMATAVETPLIGCDFSRTSAAASLIARLHWASDVLSPAILRQLASEFAGSKVSA
jgi:hypothetical protein